MAAFVNARFRGSVGPSGDRPCRGEVILELPAAEVAPYAGDGLVEQLDDGRCRLLLGSWSWAGLAASLGRFDADLHIVGPAELRAAAASLAGRYAKAVEPD